MADSETNAASSIDQAVAEGGAYEVLRRRLSEQGSRLRGLAEALNSQRLSEFGSSEMQVIGRLRVRTEHNGVARDIVQVGDRLLFGYNVFMGLKRETQVGDVFGLYQLVEGADGYEGHALDQAGSFLAAASFVNDFRELYSYYKHTRLLQLTRRDDYLLAAFQIGERIGDQRVFRWQIPPAGGEPRYIDNRGERDLAPPPAYDFEWTRCGRDDVVAGRHPHLNIEDTVFVETIGGDLTVKVENNTEDGLGIYREPVNDQTQSIDDAEISYARLGSLILLRVLPYREPQARYLVFNTLSRRVQRIDAIGQACVQLPEDHGIVFPGGYYLQNGEYKTFERSMAGMAFKRMIRSPNGEDVLYQFRDPESGRIALFTYNMIQRRLQTPLFGHGAARFDDGRLVLFSSESDEPTRVHPMQIWRTPFCSDEHAARQPTGSSFMARVGNAELVRGLSDLLSLCREIESEEVSSARYDLLSRNAARLFDLHHWLSDGPCADAAAVVREIAQTSEAVLDEFAKVESIRSQSERALREAQTRQQQLRGSLHPDRFDRIGQFVDGLNGLSAQRGHLLSIREYRYIDVAACAAMEQELLALQQRLSAATFAFLLEPRALQPFDEQIVALDRAAQEVTTTAQLKPALGGLQTLADDLDMLSGLVATLPIDDASQRTAIVEAIAALYARLNQAKARAEQRRRGLGSAEAVAQFGAQFSLFGQSVTSALAAASDPERCDEQLARVLLQLEQLESQFGEHEDFLNDILGKREEVLEAFEGHRQALLDQRQRKAQSVFDAAQRILDGLPRRTARLADSDALNAFFAGDPLILKVRELVERLRELRDSVKADDLEAKLKAARDQAVRALRDASELFEAGGEVIKLGPRHRFSVNRQELDLTLLPRGDSLCLHLTGTDYLEPIEDAELTELRPFWELSLESESADLYRGEYLAAAVLEAAERGAEGLSREQLARWTTDPDALQQAVRQFANPRYKEGYEKGIHDHDAALILQAWLPLRSRAGTLAFEPAARALAVLAWLALRDEPTALAWPLRARQARQLRELTGATRAADALTLELAGVLDGFALEQGLQAWQAQAARAAAYLVEELAAEHPQFQFSRHAQHLLAELRRILSAGQRWEGLQATLAKLDGRLAARCELLGHWLEALPSESVGSDERRFIPEAIALWLVDQRLPMRVSEVELEVSVSGMLGQHPRIVDAAMSLAVDDLGARLARHHREFLPGLRRFQLRRQQLLQTQRSAMRLQEFKPRPLTSFVRNRLINDIYLPIIGDNLAKQIGTVGESKRSDLMGLLLLISPPGYGKTTLMEYVADRLGLIFMKINGPALGHEVRSLDPAQAPDATSRQELEKLSLALEMGNNVMLYVDDIQHTHPEFLQKFISLCDGSRRIEGVWRGRTRTYDLRGKKFCVVMAGNPYTESGELFRIPDMLANRADVYNLGDVLGGMQEAFLLSYIENALTNNPVLAPLATRDISDVYRLIDKALGREFSANSLSHSYSGAEINEIVATLERLIQLRDVVFRVNQHYIASAAQAEDYRSEPAFKLQGSYRNMNKLAEKVRPVMNAQELDQLIRDHYLGEAQLLTSGAEENLLKLNELRGTLTTEEAQRWEQIKHDYARQKAIGGADSDTGTRLVAQLHDLVQSVRALPTAGAERRDAGAPAWDALIELLQRIASEQALARTFSRDTASDSAMWLGGLRNALELGFKPLLQGLQLRAEQQAELNAVLGRIAERLPGLAGD